MRSSLAVNVAVVMVRASLKRPAKMRGVYLGDQRCRKGLVGGKMAVKSCWQ